MADDEIAEWKKLSTFDKVQHANWKCRKMGYEDLQKELQRSMEGDAIFKKYSILVKKLVTEQNELSRMLASEVAVLVVEGMTTKDAAKVATGVVDGIILKVDYKSLYSYCYKTFSASTQKPKHDRTAPSCVYSFSSMKRLKTLLQAY